MYNISKHTGSIYTLSLQKNLPQIHVHYLANNSTPCVISVVLHVPCIPYFEIYSTNSPTIKCQYVARLANNGMCRWNQSTSIFRHSTKVHFLFMGPTVTMSYSKTLSGYDVHLLSLVINESLPKYEC